MITDAQRRTGDDFELLGPPGGQRLRLRFEGLYQQRPTRWNATLVAVARDVPQFIEIGATGPDGHMLMVGLRVACFDRPTIRKVIVMIRRYRRLRPGRHEFGGR